ncbi:MAG TPA: aldehyde dehydrogenase [Gaiellaceae bacterium]|nr:aldehyde dehydrogenase [Gaiellaceae bacterium]
MSSPTFIDENPATGDVLAELPEADAAAIDAAVSKARRALAVWQAIAPRERGRLLNRLADGLEQESEGLARLETTDNGRPIRETMAQQRIIPAFYRYFAGWCDKIEGSTVPVEGEYLNYTERVPVGVCAAITPWNHPLLIATKKIAPALACGNTIVVKPSELAPLSVVELARIALDAGLPEGVLTVLTGQRETGQALSVHPDVDRLDLTGSTSTGIAIQRQAASTMKRLGLELGGKAANIVFADADFEAALEGALFAGFIGQGQTCIAGARVLVERPILDRFLEAFSRRTDAVRVGDPLRQSTQLGPLISAAALDRTAAYVGEAVDQAGATLAAGGERPDLGERLRGGHFYRPTVLFTSDHRIRAAQEEIFAPVVVVIPFADEAEAVRIANDVPFGLGAGVWTENVGRAHRVARALRAGTTWINDYHRVDPASPWGGFALSGYGRENGVEAIRMFTEVKSTWVRLRPPETGWYATDDEQRLS